MGEFIVVFRLVIVLILVLICGNESGFAQSRGKEIKKPTIEIYTWGKGLIMESPRKLLFCRIAPSGAIAYDSRNENDLKRLKYHINSNSVDSIYEIISGKDFSLTKSFYGQIEPLKDAVFVIEIIISYGQLKKKIVIKNYMPSHPRAASFYPDALVKLLSNIQRIRPLNNFEQKHNLSLELPN
jgi:hypothetical protein